MSDQGKPARDVRRPGPEHPVAIERNAGRIVVTLGGRVVADSRKALILREASYPPVHDVPRADVDMPSLQRSGHRTYCPYKGEASYFSIAFADARSENAVWSHEDPHPDVAEIKDHLAFYPDRVDVIDQMP